MFTEQRRIYLGSFEEIVLLAILRLGETAYGARVREKVSEVTERSISIGAIYATVDRLERKGLIKSGRRTATIEGEGKPKRYYSIDALGVQALNDTREARSKLRAGTNRT
jgi:PadR family transcriptional regulator PadR